MIRIGIAAAAPAVRAGLRALLSDQPDLVVLYTAPLHSESLSQEDPPEVLVVLPAAEDLAYLPEVVAASAAPAVLLMENGEVHPGRLVAGLSEVVWGIMPLESDADELLAAVRALSQGLQVFEPGLLAAWLAEPEREPLELDGLEINLTERETEVLQLLAQGLANKQIALELGISEHTVKFHISSLYTKLGASSRTEAVHLGVRQGLITF